MHACIFVLGAHTGRTQGAPGQQQQQPQQQRPNYNVSGFSSPGPHKATAGGSVIGSREERGLRRNFGDFCCLLG